MSAFTRWRLNVPEVAALLSAQARLLTDYAETEPGSPERNDLLRSLHQAADELAERAYFGEPLWSRISYWIRPYDQRLDDRVWRWRRPGPCRVIYLSDGES